MGENRQKFTLNKMCDTLDEIMDKYLSSIPEEVKIELPKLKKIKEDKVEPPKIKLPKLKKLTKEKV